MSNNQSIKGDCTNQTSFWKQKKAGRINPSHLFPSHHLAPIWILIWMVRLMSRTKSFEAWVLPGSFTPPSQSNAISHLTPQSLRNWSPYMAIDRVGVWTCARAEHGGKGQEQDVRLAQFFCYGNRWSPTMGEISLVRSCGATAWAYVSLCVCICVCPQYVILCLLRQSNLHFVFLLCSLCENKV